MSHLLLAFSRIARFTIFIPDDLAARLEAARPQDVPRSKFIRRALEKALSEAKGSSGVEQDGPAPSQEAVRLSAPSRAPKTPRAQPEKPLDHLKSAGLLQPAKYVKPFNPQPKK